MGVPGLDTDPPLPADVNQSVADKHRLRFVVHRQQQQLEQRERNRKPDEPADRRLALQHDRADFVRDGAKRQLCANDRMRRVN